jgi:hypothetical protein
MVVTCAAFCFEEECVVRKAAWRCSSGFPRRITTPSPAHAVSIVKLEIMIGLKHTFPRCGEVSFEGGKSGSLQIIPSQKKIPSKEATQILNRTVSLNRRD